MDKQNLQRLIQKQLSTRQIANEMNVSQSTIKYWLKKYNLKTNPSRGPNKTNKIIKNKVYCPYCESWKSYTNFYVTHRKNGNIKYSPYCKTCHNTQTLKRQRKCKKMIVEYMGGKCQKCGYNKCIASLEIHHKDPNEKDPKFQNFKLRKFNETFKKELDKCILLCSNCHNEEHYCN